MAGFIKKLLTVITSIIEIFAASGMIFGWSELDYVFTQKGYFSAKCNVSTLNQTFNLHLCKTQQYNLELILTLSLVLSTFCSVFGGFIMDRYGTMVFRTFSTCMFVVGGLAIAFSTPQVSWILYPGIIILTTGGIFLYISVLQTANLFPKYRGIIVNVLNGATGASFMISTFVKDAYEAGISLFAIFLFIAIVVGSFATLRTYFLMPRVLIPFAVSEQFSYGIGEYCNGTKSSFDDESAEQTRLLSQSSAENINSEIGQESKHDKNEHNFHVADTPSIKSSMLNSLYILGTFSLVVQWFRVNFFVESFDVWLKYLIPHNPQLLSFDISLFGYVQILCIVFTLLNGGIFDLFYGYFKKKKFSQKQATLKTMVIVCLTSSLVSIAYSIFTLIDNSQLQYASMILFAYANIAPGANLSLLLIQIFPMQQFGTLYGFANCLVGIATAIQYAFFYVAIHYYDGNFFVVNVIVLIPVIFTLAHPANVYRCYKNSMFPKNEALSP